MEANIETRESTREKARAALGLDLSSALDLVSRSDYEARRHIWTRLQRPSWNAAIPNTDLSAAA